MKRYYINNGNLYSSDIPIHSEGFKEIAEEEYNERIAELSKNREVGVPAPSYDENENTATDSDFIASLESLGVDFGE